MENKDILNALQNYEMTFGTAENIFNGGLLTDAERDFVMRDSNAFLFGLIADQSVKAETAWSLPYKLAQRLGHFSMQKIAKESSSEEIVHCYAQSRHCIAILAIWGGICGRQPKDLGYRNTTLRREYLGQCDCHGDRRAVGGVLWDQPQKGFHLLVCCWRDLECRNIR